MMDWTDIAEIDPAPDRDSRFDRPPLPPLRERRAHARAHRYWQQLRGGRRLPDLADVDPPALRSYAGNSVLFEVGGADTRATVRFIGAALAAEAGADRDRPQAVVPQPGTVLGELADRLPLIAATGAPLDFEAEFLGLAGQPTLYRGVLLPFADAGGRTGYVYGVITWKMIATAGIGDDIRMAVGSAFALVPTQPAATPWDRPLPASGSIVLPEQTLAQRVAAARTWAALAETDHARRAASLHAALSATYDLLLDGAVEAGGGIDAAVVLVFGDALDAPAQTRYRATVTRAAALRLGSGTLGGVLDRFADGVAGFLDAPVVAEAAPMLGAYMHLSPAATPEEEDGAPGMPLRQIAASG